MTRSRLFGFIALIISIIIIFGGCTPAEYDENNETKILLEKKYYTMEEIPVYNDAVKLYGVAIIPKNRDDKIPLLILSHGYMLNHLYMLEFVPKLVKAGIGCYCFDFAGGALKNKSTGSFKQMSPLTEVSDLNSVIDTVSELDFVDKNNIYLMGHSQGGLVSAYVAARRPEQIKSIFLLAPAFIFSENSKFLTDKYTNKFREDSSEIHLFDDFTDYKSPVYIFHGDLDKTVPVEFSRDAAKAYDNCTLTEYKYQNHDFTITRKRQVASEIADIILQNKNAG